MRPETQTPQTFSSPFQLRRPFGPSLGSSLLLLLLFSILWTGCAASRSSARTTATQAHVQTFVVLVAQMQTLIATAQTGTLTPTETPAPTATPTSSPTPLPGATQTNPIDGMTQIYIPAGEFLMGGPVNPDVSDPDDRPQRSIYLDAFWVAQTTVTNAMYKLCYEAEKCPKPIREELNPHYYDPAFGDHPVVYVTWDDARQYCEWSGGRLPSEAEWEKAARGVDGRTYPWGNYKPNASLANVGGDLDSTVPVGSYPRGASPYGVLDMGSNVREWVADWYQPGRFKDSKVNPTGPEAGEKRVLRGASWFDPFQYVRAVSRLAHAPDSAGWNRGFRCAYDL